MSMSTLVERITEYEAKIGMHRAGSLAPAPLDKLEWYLQSYFEGKAVRSVETGCGASTIIFAQYAAQHTVYCFDDRSEDRSSVSYAQNFPGFGHKYTRWIYGPTQRTIFSQPLEHAVDIVLIDGPHGYPFPELEYFAFYPWLQQGGILIVDDIHIPTINNLYKFLLQDDSFRADGVVATTAYFRRAEAAAFNMEGDGWWLQRYNAQRFPRVTLDRPVDGVRLPISLVFDRRLATGAPILARGFSVLDTPPVSEGAVSNLELRLARDVPAEVTIQLDIEPVCVDERDGCGMSVLVNTKEVGRWPFTSSGRQTVELRAPTNRAETLSLEFWNYGLKTGNELKDWVKSESFDGRMPNFWLHAITVSDSAARPVSVRRADGSIITFDYEGQEFSFFVDQAEDSIEIFHTVGRFYELDELEMLRAHVPAGMCVLDIGAHVGNHTVYFEKVMQARRVLAVEPAPRAQFLLRTNCALNRLRNVDLSYLGKALGRQRASGSLVRDTSTNSGGVSLRVGPGAVPIYKGDDLFAGETLDLIKIDVEGMELDVLAGLARTIERCRPVMFIEVRDENRSALMTTLQHWRYDVIWAGQMYPQLTNVLVKPSANPRTWRETLLLPGLRR
jgi:FkbM family methyltransferase